MTQNEEQTSRQEREATYERAKEIIRANHGLAKTVMLTDAGITYKKILYLVEQGRLIRAKSGYYALPDEDVPEEEAILSQFADGVLTMQTALFYQGYLTERPAVWTIAISKNVSKSRFKLQQPPVQPYFTEEKVLALGVETMKLAGEGHIHIYTVDRLICDVMKYRDRVSAEDFRKAVRAYLDDDRKDLALLMQYAAERRVQHKVENILGTWIALPEDIIKPAPRKKKRTTATAAKRAKDRKSAAQPTDSKARTEREESRSATAQESRPEAWADYTDGRNAATHESHAEQWNDHAESRNSAAQESRPQEWIDHARGRNGATQGSHSEAWTDYAEDRSSVTHTASPEVRSQIPNRDSAEQSVKPEVKSQAEEDRNRNPATQPASAGAESRTRDRRAEAQGADKGSYFNRAEDDVDDPTRRQAEERNAAEQTAVGESAQPGEPEHKEKEASSGERRFTYTSQPPRPKRETKAERARRESAEKSRRQIMEVLDESRSYGQTEESADESRDYRKEGRDEAHGYGQATELAEESRGFRQTREGNGENRRARLEREERDESRGYGQATELAEENRSYRQARDEAERNRGSRQAWDAMDRSRGSGVTPRAIDILSSRAGRTAESARERDEEARGLDQRKGQRALSEEDEARLESQTAEEASAEQSQREWDELVMPQPRIRTEATGDPTEIATCIFIILRQMELIEDMNVIVRLYNILCNDTISGMTVSRRLGDLCEDEEFAPDAARVRKISSWEKDRFMAQKWKIFSKRQDGLSLSWQEVIQKLSEFIVPIGLSMASRRPFMGDWMPGIGRFL